MTPDLETDGLADELNVVDEDIDGHADADADIDAESESVRVGVDWEETDVTIEFVNATDILLVRV